MNPPACQYPRVHEAGGTDLSSQGPLYAPDEASCRAARSQAWCQATEAAQADADTQRARLCPGRAWGRAAMGVRPAPTTAPSRWASHPHLC